MKPSRTAAKGRAILILTVLLGASQACVGDSVDAGSSSSGEPARSDSGTEPSSSSSSSGSSSSSSGSSSSSSGSSGLADSGPDDDAQVPFSPSALPGTALWLDAKVGVAQTGSKITGWTDQSNAHLVLAQADVSKSPQLATDANGHASVAFVTNTFLSVASAPAIEVGTDDFLVEMVLSAGAGNSSYLGLLYKSNLNTSPFTGIQLFADNSGHAVAGADGVNLVVTGFKNLFDGTRHLYAFERRGTRQAVRVDSAELKALVVDPVKDVNSINPLYLGGRPDNVYGGTSSFSEIVIVRGALAETERAALEQYLVQHNGL